VWHRSAAWHLGRLLGEVAPTGGHLGKEPGAETQEETGRYWRVLGRGRCGQMWALERSGVGFRTGTWMAVEGLGGYWGARGRMAMVGKGRNEAGALLP
jgi:hypothetical protein